MGPACARRARAPHHRRRYLTLEALEVALQVLEHGAAIGVDLARQRGDDGVLAARELARTRQLGEQDRLEVALDVLLDVIPAAQSLPVVGGELLERLAGEPRDVDRGRRRG